MSRNYILIFFYLFITRLYGQDNHSGVLYYNHIQSFGMKEPIGIPYKAILAFDKYSSTYIFAKDSLQGGHFEQIKLIQKNEYEAFFVPISTSKDGFIYHMDRRANEMKTRDINFLFVKDSIPVINWLISTAEKKIGNYTCRKATGKFNGRSYTAWFTEEIPVQHGPWKLQGLPGLILEAYDKEKEIYFVFEYIKFSQNVEILIPDPATEHRQTKNVGSKNWINSKEYKEKLIKHHKKSIENGMKFMDKKFIEYNSKEKNLMGKFFLEIFETYEVNNVN